MSNPTYTLKASEISELLLNGELSSREVVQSFISRIEEIDCDVQAFLTPCFESALAQADEADKRIAKGERSPLLGVPIAVKDVIATKEIKTTGGSKILHNFTPPYNATVMNRLESAGAVLLGKLNLDEFAMGSSNENSGYYKTFNPWDLTRTPGGSSGGPAAAVAASECPITLGSDTGGSVRQPASFCNIVGVKPTYGRISRYGLLAYASSFDQIGTFGKDAYDNALIMNVIAGHDPLDSTSSKKNIPNFLEKIGEDIKGVKIGLPREYFVEGTDSEIAQAIKNAASCLKDLGADLSEVSLPHTEYAMAAYYLCVTAEASSNLSRYSGVHFGHRASNCKNLEKVYIRSRSEGFGEEVKRRIMLGTYVLSSGYYDAYYLKGQKMRTLVQRDFFNVFKQVDMILAPVSPFPPFKIGERIDNPLQMYLADVFTVPASLSGLPGMSVPCGFTQNNLPIGMQIIGRPYDEQLMFQVASAYESANNYKDKHPPI